MSLEMLFQSLPARREARKLRRGADLIIPHLADIRKVLNGRRRVAKSIG